AEGNGLVHADVRTHRVTKLVAHRVCHERLDEGRRDRGCLGCGHLARLAHSKKVRSRTGSVGDLNGHVTLCAAGGIPADSHALSGVPTDNGGPRTSTDNAPCQGSASGSTCHGEGDTGRRKYSTRGGITRYIGSAVVVHLIGARDG